MLGCLNCVYDVSYVCRVGCGIIGEANDENLGSLSESETEGD